MPRVNSAALKALLETGADPVGTRFAPYFSLPGDAVPGAGNDDLCAALLNNVHPTAMVPREPVPLDKLVVRLRAQDLAIKAGSSDADAAKSQALSQLNVLLGFLSTGSGTVELSDPDVFAQVVAFFEPGSESANRLAAMRVRKASVAESLFGRGVTLSAEDIGRARQEG